MSCFLGLGAWMGGLGDQAWVVFPHGNASLWADWYVCTGLSLPLGSGVFIRVMDHDDDDDAYTNIYDHLQLYIYLPLFAFCVLFAFHRL